MLHTANILFHNILKDNKLVKLRKYLFRHALSQDMGFFDSKTVGEIRSAINPNKIMDVISWQIPYMVNDVLNLIFVVYHMQHINQQLTLISIFFIILCQIGLHPIEKVGLDLKQLSDPLCNKYPEIGVAAEAERETCDGDKAGSGRLIQYDYFCQVIQQRRATHWRAVSGCGSIQHHQSPQSYLQMYIRIHQICLWYLLLHSFFVASCL